RSAHCGSSTWSGSTSPRRSAPRSTPTRATPPTGRRAGSSRWWARAGSGARPAPASTTTRGGSGGGPASAAGQVPDHVGLRDPLAAGASGDLAPRKLRLRELVPAGELHRLQRAAQRGAEVILGAQHPLQDLELLVGEPNQPHRLPLSSLGPQ